MSVRSGALESADDQSQLLRKIFNNSYVIFAKDVCTEGVGLVQEDYSKESQRDTEAQRKSNEGLSLLRRRCNR